MSGAHKYQSGKFHLVWHQKGSLILAAPILVLRAQSIADTTIRSHTFCTIPPRERLGRPSLHLRAKQGTESPHGSGGLGKRKHRECGSSYFSRGQLVCVQRAHPADGHACPSACIMQINFWNKLLFIVRLETQPSPALKPGS